MSGVPAAALTNQQADEILQAVVSRLRIVLTSPVRTPPATPITASLVPAAPEIDVSDLVNGILNVAGVAKDVVFRNDDPLPIPSSGDLDGDQVITAADSVTGGQPFPIPQGPVLSTANLTQTNVPGLLGQLFGTFGLPSLKVQLQIRWIVRDQAGRELREEKGDLLAQNGLASPSVSLIVPPVIRELRLDTVLVPPTPQVVCLSAEVTLNLGARSLGPVEVGPVPVVVLPLLIPTVVFLFSEPNFNVVVNEDVDDLDLDDSSVVIVVPEHSPFVSAAPLFKALRTVESVRDSLSGLGGFLGFLLGLDLDAIEGQPRFRFVATNRISDLEDIKLKPHKIFGFTYRYDNFDDRAFSLLVIGLPGTVIRFFNDEDFMRSPDTTQGLFTIRIGAECFVAIRTLDTDDDVAPVTLPPDRVIDFEADQQGDDRWHTDMTSLEFDDQWLKEVEGEPPGTLPKLDCADAIPPVGSGHPRPRAGVTARPAAEGRRR